MHQDDLHFENPQASFVNVQHFDNLFVNQDQTSPSLNDFSLKGFQRPCFKSKKRSFKKNLRKIKKQASALYEQLEYQDLLDDGSFNLIYVRLIFLTKYILIYFLYFSAESKLQEPVSRTGHVNRR